MISRRPSRKNPQSAAQLARLAKTCPRRTSKKPASTWPRLVQFEREISLGKLSFCAHVVRRINVRARLPLKRSSTEQLNTHHYDQKDTHRSRSYHSYLPYRSRHAACRLPRRTQRGPFGAGGGTVRACERPSQI